MSKFAGLTNNLTLPTNTDASKAAKPAKAKAETGSAPTSTPTGMSAQTMALYADCAYRDNPELAQVSGFIHKDTHKEVRKALIDDGRDLSKLLQELLESWLASR